MSVLILGNDDTHTQAVAQAIEAQGQQVVLWDTRHFPYYQSLSVTPSIPPEGSLSGFTANSKPISLHWQDVTAIYWYCFEGVVPPPAGQLPGQGTGQYTHKWENLIHSTLELLASLPLSHRPYWMNPPATIRQHQWKAVQLQQVSMLGVPLPKTLFSNDPEAIQAFIKRHQLSRLVAKSPEGSGVPAILDVADLTEDLLDTFRFNPGQFQAFIEGTDIRVHVVGEQLFPTQIITTTGCYKTDNNLRIEAIELPLTVREQCLQIAQCLNYELAGIDFRRTPDGEFIFLEANPSPQFMIFDAQACHGTITQAVATQLCRKTC